VTTQNTHHEHNDVDANVVEHPFASESVADPITSETTPPDEPAPLAASASSAPAAPDEIQEHQPVPEASTEEHHAEPEQEKQSRDIQADASSETAPAPEPEPAPAESEPEPVEGSAAFPYAHLAPFVEAQGEEVRPFMAFIEEFRQAEARLSASVQESQTEVFTLLPSTEGDFAVPEPEVSSETTFPVLDASEVVAPEPVPDTAEAGATEETPSPAATTTVEESQAAAPATEETAAVAADKETPVEPAPVPVERPVSPLLRPPTRVRMPRHGTVRHPREEAVAETPAPPAVEPPAPPAPPAPAEPEQPRPARRYRFDRPAASNGAAGTTLTPPTPVRPEEGRPFTGSTFARTDNGSSASEQAAETTTKAAASAAPAVEQQMPQPAESIAPPPAQAATEHGRRRGHERTKEQPAAATPPVAPPPAPAELAAPAPEVPAPAEEVAPEDLPPLEYSELQKASTRRRRRHRSSNGSTPTAPAVEVPTQLPATPPASAPNTPSAPAAAAAPQYTIVSGYTVNQMNQGNELSGPFMGPEPSPARGSLLTRDARSGRAEVQRAPAYPSRPHEGSSSSASMHQFATIVAQSIQTQTDRMVAELRRANQAPTNVSVSLPPFPSTERVGVFVDVANLLYSARTLRIAVDFGKLLDFLRGNRRLVRAHAYCPTSPQPGDEQMFLQAVKGLGYRITTKNYKTFSSGAKKADLDLDLCMDVVRLVDGRAVDCIVLVSGDSDFMPMLDYCSDHGVRVEVAAFDEAMSATLRQSCDLFVNLSMLEEIRA
jgi:uncharacterized LabA/DUF88 family protein